MQFSQIIFQEQMCAHWGTSRKVEHVENFHLNFHSKISTFSSLHYATFHLLFYECWNVIPRNTCCMPLGDLTLGTTLILITQFTEGEIRVDSLDKSPEYQFFYRAMTSITRSKVLHFKFSWNNVLMHRWAQLTKLIAISDAILTNFPLDHQTRQAHIALK